MAINKVSDETKANYDLVLIKQRISRLNEIFWPMPKLLVLICLRFKLVILRLHFTEECLKRSLRCLCLRFENKSMISEWRTCFFLLWEVLCTLCSFSLQLACITISFFETLFLIVSYCFVNVTNEQLSKVLSLVN